MMQRREFLMAKAAALNVVRLMRTTPLVPRAVARLTQPGSACRLRLRYSLIENPTPSR